MFETTTSQPPIKFAWLVGVPVAFVLFVVIGAYSARMTKDYPDYNKERTAARYETLAKLRADETKTLTTADWVDQAKGTVRIPIDEAMVKEIDTLKSIPLHQGDAIPGATPAPAPSTNAAPAAAAPSTNAAPAAPPAPAPAAKPTK